MTDSEKIAAPAEQPAASEKPMSAVADAVETPSDSAPEKKPRRPRRKKPAVEPPRLPHGNAPRRSSLRRKQPGNSPSSRNSLLRRLWSRSSLSSPC